MKLLLNNHTPKLLPALLCILLLSSCRLLHLGNREGKSGCPTTNNIGAERIMAGDPVALKAAKKNNRKYKLGKVFNQ